MVPYFWEEGFSVRRARQLAAWFVALSTLGVGLTLPPIASAEDGDSSASVINTAETTSSNVASMNTTKAAADPIASFDFNDEPVDGAFVAAKSGAKAAVNGTAKLVAGKDAASG